MSKISGHMWHFRNFRTTGSPAVSEGTDIM